jgi:cell division protein FtsX
MSKKEVELIRYDSKLDAITSHDDERKIQNERYFISKKIEEAKQELNQLENNLGFFQHVDDDNPLVREVHKNIQRHKDELELWKEKLKKLKEVM